VRIPLETFANCFQGLLPAQLFTCSLDGVPNAAYLSHVEYVDSVHVALSFQFFNKSRRNIAENPRATVNLLDPDTGQGWSLHLHYERSESEGPLFDRMALRIEAIASYCGLKGIFRLRAADVYRVLDIEPLAEECGSPRAGASQHSGTLDPVFTVRALQNLSDRINRAESLEGLVDSILAGLEESFGFRNSMILVPSEQADVLVTLATRGYPQSGAGSEVRFGEGIVGMVAEARQPIRISGLMRGMLYALAASKSAQEPADAISARRVPLPGLSNPESQLGVPLLVRGELVGVLCLESEIPYRFHEEDKATIELLGRYLAIAIQNMQWQERAMDAASEAHTPAAEAAGAVQPSSPSAPAAHTVAYYAADECVLFDGEYLVRGLPARILWRLLTIHQSTGRREFTNRELRLDKSLGLPEWKDNLESRLLLLRRRLDEKSPAVRVVPLGRGRFALDVRYPLLLTSHP
jgi:adenylate cyclase